MDSNKSSTATARAPQRLPGRLRVAALLEAGAAVIAERGFEAATMAEIASRAGSPIGSLYRFFPNKEVLADALVERFRERLGAVFERLEAGANSQSLEAFAGALLTLMVDLQGDRPVIRALLEAHADWSAKREEFRAAVIEHLARILQVRRPGLSPKIAHRMGVMLLHNIKTYSVLHERYQGKELAAAIDELHEMTRLYLKARLAS